MSCKMHASAAIEVIFSNEFGWYTANAGLFIYLYYFFFLFFK